VALEAGVTVDDVFNWYTVKELREYCTEKGIPTGGKLREIARRVVDHLDGKEVVKKGTQTKGPGSKKRKASPSTTPTKKAKPEETKRRKKS